MVPDLQEFNNFNIHTQFYGSTIFSSEKSFKASILLSGGGGGGGSGSYISGDIYFGSGGGAGSLLFIDDILIKKSQENIILIGSGGIGGKENQKGSQGGNSYFNKYIAIGGGGGGAGTLYENRHLGSGGGSGGGSSLNGRPGPGSIKYGNFGGSSQNHGGAGGGGFFSDPKCMNSDEYTGQFGGEGIFIKSISDSTLCCGGNGGGQNISYNKRFSGGLGGKYSGYITINGTDAHSFSGSGGGGGAANLDTLEVGFGGNGSSGFCIIFIKE